jgi:hypothetical protein
VFYHWVPLCAGGCPGPECCLCTPVAGNLSLRKPPGPLPSYLLPTSLLLAVIADVPNALPSLFDTIVFCEIFQRRLTFVHCKGLVHSKCSIKATSRFYNDLKFVSSLILTSCLGHLHSSDIAAIWDYGVSGHSSWICGLHLAGRRSSAVPWVEEWGLWSSGEKLALITMGNKWKTLIARAALGPWFQGWLKGPGLIVYQMACIETIPWELMMNAMIPPIWIRIAPLPWFWDLACLTRFLSNYTYGSSDQLWSEQSMQYRVPQCYLRTTFKIFFR